MKSREEYVALAEAALDIEQLTAATESLERVEDRVATASLNVQRGLAYAILATIATPTPTPFPAMRATGDAS